MKLWDTNIVSELSRPSPNPGVLAWAKGEDAIAISAVTVDEMMFGLTRRPRPRISTWLESFFTNHCEVMDVTEPVARLAGELRGHLRAKGEVRTQADMLVAATAKIHGFSLITRNTKDFKGCGVEVINQFE